MFGDEEMKISEINIFVPVTMMVMRLTVMAVVVVVVDDSCDD